MLIFLFNFWWVKNSEQIRITSDIFIIMHTFNKLEEFLMDFYLFIFFLKDVITWQSYVQFLNVYMSKIQQKFRPGYVYFLLI